MAVNNYSIYNDPNPNEDQIKELELKYQALISGILYDPDTEVNHILWAIRQVIKQLQNEHGKTGESYSVMLEIVRDDSGFGIGVINPNELSDAQNDS